VWYQDQIQGVLCNIEKKIEAYCGIFKVYLERILDHLNFWSIFMAKHIVYVVREV
jgi:hypothetical protein